MARTTKLREANILEEIRFIEAHISSDSVKWCDCWYETTQGDKIRKSDIAYLIKFSKETNDPRLHRLLGRVVVDQDGVM